MSDGPKSWDVQLDMVASLLLRGAKAWQVAQALDCTPEEAGQAIERVLALWAQEASVEAGEGRQRSLAQLRRIQLQAWKRWDDAQDGALLRLALDCERQVIALRGELDEATVLERLPEWVPTYLAAWGSTGPDGKKMTVKVAAELAGTTDSNVRNLRERSPQFRRLEDMARHGSAERAASQVDAYLRGNSLRIIEAFDALVGQGNPQTVLKAMEWLRDKPAEVDVNLRGAVAAVQGQMSDEDAEQILNNLLLAEVAEVGAGSGVPAAATGAGDDAGSADLDDPA
jgi:hypothetical protein